MLSVSGTDELISNYANDHADNELVSKLEKISDTELKSDCQKLKTSLKFYNQSLSVDRAEIENRKAYKDLCNNDMVMSLCLHHYANTKSGNRNSANDIFEAVRLIAALIQSRYNGELTSMCRDLSNGTNVTNSFICVVLCKLTNGNS